jgi:hypothetical protein
MAPVRLSNATPRTTPPKSKRTTIVSAFYRPRAVGDDAGCS